MPHPTGRPWIVAHRGARSVAPENTVEAFRAAYRLGADAVELDVRRTGDGALVVHHDPTLGTEAQPLISLHRPEIRRMAPEIPDFDEAITACEGMWIDIEVKNSPAEPDWDPEDHTLDAVLATIERFDASDRFLVSSFNLPTVNRALRSGVRTGWLIPRTVNPLEAADAWPDPPHVFALPSLSAMGPDAARQVVVRFEEVGAEVGVWNVNDSHEISRLTSAGVGAIFTDDVELARDTLTA